MAGTRSSTTQVRLALPFWENWTIYQLWDGPYNDKNVILKRLFATSVLCWKPVDSVSKLTWAAVSRAERGTETRNIRTCLWSLPLDCHAKVRPKSTKKSTAHLHQQLKKNNNIHSHCNVKQWCVCVWCAHVNMKSEFSTQTTWIFGPRFFFSQVVKC